MPRGDSPTTRSKPLTTDARARYETAHWGEPSTTEYDWPDAPDNVRATEMGKLVEIRFEVDDGDEGVLDGFKRRGAEPDILCFSPKVDERLYFALSTASKDRMRRSCWVRRHPTYTLDEVAQTVGGRQARFAYAPMFPHRVQAIGRVTAVAYFTTKRGDPTNSEYEHEMGEWGGVRPMLCVSPDGALWLAGGSYTVPDEGITK